MKDEKEANMPTAGEGVLRAEGPPRARSCPREELDVLSLKSPVGLKRRWEGRVPDSPGLADPEEGRPTTAAYGGRGVVVQGRIPESLERKRGDNGGQGIDAPLRDDSCSRDRSARPGGVRGGGCSVRVCGARLGHKLGVSAHW